MFECKSLLCMCIAIDYNLIKQCESTVISDIVVMHAQKSLQLSTSNFEDENEEVADTCHCLAMTLMSICELDEASSLFERALAIRKKKLGALDLNIASTLYYLGMIGQMRGSWNISMKHCKEAVRIQRMVLGDDNPITASTLECIGRIHMDKREFENAIQCFTKCISHGNLKLQREMGNIHLFRGESFKGTKMMIRAGQHAVQLLGLSMCQGEFDLLHLTTKFNEQKRQKTGRDLLRYAENVMFYGRVLLKMERFNEALECVEFSNVIFEGNYGSDHLTIAGNLHATGFILEKLSDISNSDHQLVEALELTAEALRISEDISFHLSYIYIYICSSTHNFTTFILSYFSPTGKLHLVESHPDLEETLLLIGRVHHKLGNIHEALTFLTDAAKARDVRLGRNHRHMDDANALLEVGQLQQQVRYFVSVIGRYNSSDFKLSFIVCAPLVPRSLANSARLSIALKNVFTSGVKYWAETIQASGSSYSTLGIFCGKSEILTSLK